MRIRINNTTIDYSLEGEKNLGEVLQSIDGLLSQDGLLITSVEADGLPVTDQLAEVASRDLTSIEHLDITVSHPHELSKQKLDIVLQFLLACREILATDQELTPELRARIDDVEPLVRQIFGSLAPSQDNGTEGTGTGPLAALLSPGRDLPGLEVRMNNIGELIAATEQRLREFESPLQELANLQSSIKESIDEISEAPVLLQTGKDREAMTGVIHFTEVCGRLLRLYGILSAGGANIDGLRVGEAHVSEFFVELNKILTELVDAMAVSDTVLIGDLLEYEIAPRLQDLLAVSASLTATGGQG